ncbi:uncharacterized protein BDR25DRAFT_228610 [Lindgomyces ingoldianus]|uniref:Uncharacterized protein n=1 Tax=Lindgomyces ingoldianus TaxID=673940 RepID=A0ACB6QU30_9PLEO|nr:uncharacterized protein BDR25DRAFT_228610 [Lindgomyces ingoldianus]KAF2469671.1 hypothetical protein BDR25DRAFT_228610 [Lindgomyces ingoldianus]
MVASSFIIAASSIFALSFGAPVTRSQAIRSLVERGTYAVFGGDGSTTAGWPKQSDWKTLDKLWTANLDTLKSSCTQFGGVANNGPEELTAIRKGLESTSQKSGVPAEFLFAVMMQESKGCVRAPTTNYGVRNPGLMQDHDGKATCNEGGVQNPCPATTITQMIEEGAGIGNDFGLKQTIELSKASDDSKYYKAARIYNSGSIAASGNLGDGIATHCYASDIANRLLGWADDDSGCVEATIGSLTSSQSFTSGGGGDSNNTPTPTTTPTPVPSSTGDAPKPTISLVGHQEGNGNGATVGEANPSAPKAAGVSTSCKGYYTVKSGDTCSSVESAMGIASGTLNKLNGGLSADCTNLWLGYAYCVSA